MPKSCGKDCPLRPGYAYTNATNPDPIRLFSHNPLDQAQAAQKLYQPIKEWQTRIVVLRDEADTSARGEIFADLITIDLIWAKGAVVHETQQKIDYTALSYTWGAPVFSQRLILNGIAYSITDNLYQFLRRCRQETAMRRLWIDAVCINQYDNAERSQQVANMLNIYRKAAAVRVWLGEAGPHTDLAIGYLRWDDGTSRKHSSACREKMPSLLLGLRDLYTRPYLSRIWIRQEIWAGDDVKVMCGTRHTIWSRFADAKDVLSDLVTQAGPLSTEDSNVDALAKQVSSLPRRRKGELADPEDDEPVAPYIGGRKNDLVTALRKSVQCECTDVADRVYGLLGMTKTKLHTNAASAETALSLRVDYNRRVGLIFEDVARYLMKRESSVSSILCLAGHFGGEGIPSWVPDWRVATSYKPFLFMEYLIRGQDKKQDQSDDDEDKHDEHPNLGQSKLSDDGRVPSVIPTFSIDQCDEGILNLRGCTIATILNDAPPRFETEIWLAYRDAQHPTRLFKDPLLLEEGSASKVVDHLHSASEEQKAKYCAQLKSTGSFQPEIKLPAKKSKLRSADVEISQVQRVHAPLPADDESQETLLHDVKLVHVKAADSNHVPLNAFLQTRYARSILARDQKSRAKAASKAKKKREREQVKKTAKSENQKAKKLAVREKKTSPLTARTKRKTGSDSDDESNDDSDSDDEDEMSDGGSDDSDDDDSDDSDEDGSDDDCDDESDNDSDDDDDDDEDDDSDDSDDDDDESDGLSVATDENFDDLDIYEHEPDDAGKYYAAPALNQIYNEWSCSELVTLDAALPGDVVVMVEGCVLPLVLRPVPADSSARNDKMPSYSYVGPALLSYHGTPVNPAAPNAWEYQLKQNCRPQMSVYAHWQALLLSKVLAGSTTEYRVI